jgi:uncharacterized protein YaaR (DUF327 family)
MSNQITDKAREYLGHQLSVIPTKEDKTPTIAWTPYQSNKMSQEEVEDYFNKATVKGIAVICGAVSGNLEVIDIDTKYDITGALWEEFTSIIQGNLPLVYSSLLIAQTKSGGYHIYYRCSLIQGNLKLANRPTTRDEKNATYTKEIESGATKEKALRVAENDKVRVLIETRGQGGYVVAPPTPGYSYIQGEPGNIPILTPEERDSLLSIAKSFNELPQAEPKVSTPTTVTPSSPGLSPFEDYNERGDVVDYLEDKGWKVVRRTAQKIYLLRPGDTTSAYSGNFHTELRTLRIFSSSTEFDPDTAYNPSQVFSLLECSGDNRLAYRSLLELGYGEPYTGQELKPTQVKTKQIQVEVVNQVTQVSSVISTPGQSLKIEDIRGALGDQVLITSPGAQAQDEILEAIALIQDTGKRIYILENEQEIREYKYLLQAIFRKYGAIQEDKGGLTDRDRDSFLDEVVILSTRLDPLDKDIFLSEFLGIDAVKELGITQESLSITVDRLTSTRDKESQAQEFSKLLVEATQLQGKGEIDKALELLEGKVKEVKLKDRATEFSSLIKPITQEGLKDRLSNRPESLDSGYIIDKEPLVIPSGAISIFTAPTSHGKTTLLINLALNVAKAYPDKQAYLFSYEEDADSVLINTLNAYLDQEISSNNRRSLKSYFSTGSLEYLKGEYRSSFTGLKDVFFSEFIDTGRLNIHYSNYDSDTLIEAIRYLHKHANPGAIFIDYIQLLNLPQGKYKTYSRQEEIKEICIALKDVAVETGLPIILGAQFNREVINHIRIHATKIGEAGDIERIANLIVGFWNNNFKPYAGSDGELNEINSKGRYKPHTIYTTILKQRGGRVGLEELLDFNGNTGKIKNKPSSNNPF